MDGIALSFQEEVYEFIVDKAIEFKLGARGLRSMVEIIMIDVMFELPSSDTKELHITLEYAQSKLQKTDIEKLKAA
jgi:ATP-dependent Clp protease ATP-binding subunit ClpX